MQHKERPCSLVGSQAAVADSQAAVVDSQPAVVDSRAAVDSQPAVVDSQPAVVDSQPAVVDSRAAVVGSQSFRDRPVVEVAVGQGNRLQRGQEEVVVVLELLVHACGWALKFMHEFDCYSQSPELLM